MARIYGWLTVLAVLLAVAMPIVRPIGLISSTWADVLKWSGLSMQIGGMIIVLQGLRSKREAFGLPSSLRLAWSKIIHLLNAILGRPRSQVIEMAATATASSFARANLTVGINAAASIEQKVAFLLAQHDHTNQQLFKLETDIINNDRATKCEFEELLSQQKATTAYLENRMKKIAVGDIHLDVAGAWLLVIGTIITTIPDDIVKILQATKNLFS